MNPYTKRALAAVPPSREGARSGVWVKYAVATAIIAAVAVVVFERRDTRVLADNIGVSAYPNGIAVVQVPYRRDGGIGTATILVDGQTVVREMPAYAVKYGNDNYFFRPSDALDDRVLVRVSFGSEGVVQSALKEVKVTRARPDASTDVPDESAPSVATEAVVVLAKAHNADDKLPAYPSTITEELKSDMRWSASDGVTPENYSSGLNLWATKKNLPIRTEKVAGKNGVVLDVLSRTLAAGGTAQMYLQFKRAGRVVGGRTVGVLRVVRAGGDIFIGIRDSAGPTGTNIYRVRDGALIDYAFSDDTAVIGWGFVQIWNK